MSEYNFLKIFEAIIDEADVTSGEKEKQEELYKELDPFSSPKDKKSNLNQYDEDDSVEGVEDDSNESSEEAEETLPKKIDISTEFSDFIDAANALRASHSFNDKNVKGDLKTYHERLNKGEKQSLIVFLTGITEIAAADVDGDKVNAPHDLGITTSSISSTEKETQDDIDQEEPQEKIDRDKPEEGSPNPITVGESKQDISDIIAILNEVNKG